MKAKILVFLTDGQPTVGVTNYEELVSNTRKSNIDAGFAIFCLGFGLGADMILLEKIAIQVLI